jgi:ACS family glucarate transporter-like MFS transporter
MAASPIPLNQPPRRLWAVVALMCALSAISYFDRTIMSIAGPTIMSEFGFSEVAMGTVFSAALLSYTALMAPSGWLADKFGGRMALTVGGLLSAVFTGLTGICGSIGSFRIVRLLFGAVSAPLYPSTGRISSTWVPAHRQSFVQSLIMGTSAVGSATSPLLFAFLIRELGWRTPFWMAAALTSVLFLLWYAVVRDRPPGSVAASSTQHVSSSWKELARNRNLAWLTWAYFCLNYFEYIFFYWIYYYFGQVRHFTPSQTSQFTSITFVAMAIMTPLGGWISDHIGDRQSRAGRKWVAVGGMTFSAVLLYTGASGVGVALTVAMLALSLGFAASAEGPFWSTAIEISGENVGAACGILNTGGNLGGMLAPFITPLIATRFGWSGGLYFGCLMVLLGAATWYLISPRPAGQAHAVQADLRIAGA